MDEKPDEPARPTPSRGPGPALPRPPHRHDPRPSGRTTRRAVGAIALVLALGSVACQPETFRAELETSQGTIVMEFYPEWSPVAVDRVRALVELGHYDGARIYRVNERYAQFGYTGRPEVDAEWVGAGLPDEPTVASNTRGTVSFARGGPESRSVLLFINRGDNSNLDDLAWNGVTGFPPVGRVVSGMEAVDALEDRYGDEPLQWEDSISAIGNSFLDRRFPGLDSILTVRIVEE